MALSILSVISNAPIALPLRVVQPSRLIAVIPADRVHRDFPKQGLTAQAALRVVRPSRTVPVQRADLTVPVNMIPVQGVPQPPRRVDPPEITFPFFMWPAGTPSASFLFLSAAKGKPVVPLRVDPPEFIFPTFLWPAPPTVPLSLLFYTALEKRDAISPATLQLGSQLFGLLLPVGYTPPIVTVPEVETGVISAIRHPQIEPVNVSRLVGDFIPVMLPTIEVEASILSAIRELPKNPIAVSRLVGDVLPSPTAVIEFDVSILSAIYEVPKVPIQTSRLVGDQLAVTPPGPEIELFSVITNRTELDRFRQLIPGPSRFTGGLLLPVQNPQTRLLLELHPLREKLRYGGVHPLFPLVAGRSQSIIWLYPAPPPVICVLGIGIVPIYYTSPGPNVVPVETLTPGVLPWGWANWTDVMPVCVQPPGPNVVPVYEAPTTVPRVKIRAARPEM